MLRRPRRARWLLLGIALVLLAASAGWIGWKSLTYEPDFYRRRSAITPEQRRAEAERFLAQSLQLRNDIANEGRWEASFTDEEVNAWLAEDLVEHFSDYIPENVHDPRLSFALDRVTMAFKLDRGPFTSVVWVVARVRVSGDHTLAITVEKIRAGALPIPLEDVIRPITAHAIAHGLDIRWGEDSGRKVAYIRYTPSPGRLDVVLERIQILEGVLFVSGRSDRDVGGVSRLTLPDRRVLQMTFPINNSEDSYRPPRT